MSCLTVCPLLYVHRGPCSVQASWGGGAEGQGMCLKEPFKVAAAGNISPDALRLPRCAGEGKMFAPGNLRATFDNPAYERLINFYLGEKYTLRYTGGMVPDVFQIIVKEKGVFTNVTSPTTKAKLRILFEVAPLALLVRTGLGAGTIEDLLHVVHS